MQESFISTWLVDNYFQHQGVKHDVSFYEQQILNYAETSVDRDGRARGMMLEILFVQMAGIALMNAPVSPRFSTLTEDVQNVDLVLENGRWGTMGVSLKSSGSGVNNARVKRNRYIKKKQVPMPYVILQVPPEQLGMREVVAALVNSETPNLTGIIRDKLQDEGSGLLDSIIRQVTNERTGNATFGYFRSDKRIDGVNKTLDSFLEGLQSF